MNLLPLEEAQQRLLNLANPMPLQNLSITQSLGYYLAEPLVSRRSQPAAALSAMDGYALRWADMPGPWTVIGESAAGHSFSGHVGESQTVRISTGAIVPDGADTVIVQEDVDKNGAQILLTGDGPPRQGAHIRAAGNDFQDGTALMQAGDRISPAAIALAIMGGQGEVIVRERPSVALISTGDELVPLGSLPSGPHQIPASNGPMLAAMLARFPVDTQLGDNVPDDKSALIAALENAKNADVIVTTGGASVGDHDHLHDALSDLGIAVDFWRVAIKPGKPVMVAKWDDTIILGLPGNPVSAFVTAVLLLDPLIRSLCGAGSTLPDQRRAIVKHDLPSTAKRAEFIRARFVDGMLHPLGNQDSAALLALARGEALIIRAANSGPVKAGEQVDYIPIA